MEHLLAKEGVAGSIPVSRLKKERYQIGIVLFFERWSGLESSMSTLRSGPRSPRSPGPRAPSRASFICSGSLDFTGFPLFLCGCKPAPTCTQSIYCIGYNAFSNKFCVSSVASLVTKAAGKHPKINLLLAAKATYGCQGTRYGTVLSKAS